MEPSETTKGQGLENQASPAMQGTPPFKAETYWQHLDAMDLTEAQKASFLHELWLIMVGFVDLGFGMDPVQQIVPAMIYATMGRDFDDAANNNTHREDKK